MGELLMKTCKFYKKMHFLRSDTSSSKQPSKSETHFYCDLNYKKNVYQSPLRVGVDNPKQPPCNGEIDKCIYPEERELILSKKKKLFGNSNNASPKAET